MPDSPGQNGSSTTSNQSGQSISEKPWHCPRGGFVNPWKSYRGSMDLGRMVRFFWKLLRTRMIQKVSLKPVVRQLNWEPIRNPPKEAALITWLGHACFLLQLNGKTIITDPVLSER
jgi:N-acyl-phosphatidylethanolamine-hydrolysing phospholipase D